MDKNISYGFNNELTKVALRLNPMPIMQRFGKQSISGVPGSVASEAAKNQFKRIRHKPPLSPGWKKAKNIAKGVGAGIGAAGLIGGAGTIYGGLTMEPGIAASYSGESPSVGPVYGGRYY
jgi:hypothetical protein